MTKRIQLIVGVLSAFILASCANVSENSTSSIVLTMPMVARSVSVSDVSWYYISVFKGEVTPVWSSSWYVKEENHKDAKPGETVEFYDLDAGIYTVWVRAYGASAGDSGYFLASGIANATVVEGETQEVAVTMNWIDVTVTFDTSGGTEIEPQTLRVGDTLSELPPTPTKEGYTFGGWYLWGLYSADNYSNTEFDISQPIYYDLTLYARWSSKVNGISVTFNETENIDTIELVKTETDTSISYSVPSGYSAQTWYVDGDWLINGIESTKGFSVSSDNNTLTITPSLLVPGTYDVFVEVYATEGIGYSSISMQVKKE
mgnify:CR=1 FL=1